MIAPLAAVGWLTDFKEAVRESQTDGIAPVGIAPLDA
jgi:hypothetical protein